MLELARTSRSNFDQTDTAQCFQPVKACKNLVLELSSYYFWHVETSCQPSSDTRLTWSLELARTSLPAHKKNPKDQIPAQMHRGTRSLLKCTEELFNAHMVPNEANYAKLHHESLKKLICLVVGLNNRRFDAHPKTLVVPA